MFAQTRFSFSIGSGGSNHGYSQQRNDAYGRQGYAQGFDQYQNRGYDYGDNRGFGRDRDDNDDRGRSYDRGNAYRGNGHSQDYREGNKYGNGFRNR